MNRSAGSFTMKRMLFRVSLTVGALAAVGATAAFFISGEYRESESRARGAAENKAIFATAAERGTTYHALQMEAEQCPSPECRRRVLYGNNFDRIWQQEQFMNWFELPLFALLAFGGGMAAVYAVGALFVVVSRVWWPWVRGK
ncbi:hypothetical protein [Bradyrhizobium sp. AS23.2]|uniref:hypothetical protein n=1 Tax=Bradyrhizobium sp. AS23.2 TaxID=1680155 RepID=UPI0011612C2C|nr:hypothetical protein [Bradyrhizobium sp. AS23.2]